jgi:hypothetical protein
MYLARFSYEIAPKNRQSALKSIRQEAEAARAKGLVALHCACIIAVAPDCAVKSPEVGPRSRAPLTAQRDGIGTVTQ